MIQELIAHLKSEGYQVYAPKHLRIIEAKRDTQDCYGVGEW